MKYPIVLIAVLGSVGWGCHSGNDSSVLPTQPTIESRTITTAELPPEFDASRTYHYPLPTIKDPKGVLVTLLDAGIAVSRAWQPLDDRCLDPIGPTFTVELRAADPSMQDQGFEVGVGRLWCATTLTEYTVIRAGS